MTAIKSKILVLGPVLADWSQIVAIKQTLQFLSPDYDMDYTDPLGGGVAAATRVEFYQKWRHFIKNNCQQYDAIFGFSLGGVILQQCFGCLASFNKPIVLFSTPSFIDSALSAKLKRIITLASQFKLEAAMAYKNSLVGSTTSCQPKIKTRAELTVNQACLRLKMGMELVLNTDSRRALRQNPLPHLHLIGAQSKLVNKNNVIAPSSGSLSVVPAAGMRVLADNLEFASSVILKEIRNYATN